MGGQYHEGGCQDAIKNGSAVEPWTSNLELILRPQANKSPDVSGSIQLRPFEAAWEMKNFVLVMNLPGVIAS